MTRTRTIVEELSDLLHGLKELDPEMAAEMEAEIRDAARRIREAVGIRRQVEAQS